MEGTEESASTGPAEDRAESVTSRHAMGIRRLGNALKKARGTMSQKAAAAAWGVPVATLGAIEQGVERNYQPPTVAPFDQVLGTSAWDMLQGPDETPADTAMLEMVRAELRAEFAVQVATLTAELARLAETLETRRSPGLGVAGLLEDMDADEVAAVAAFVHLILARRRAAG